MFPSSPRVIILERIQLDDRVTGKDLLLLSKKISLVSILNGTYTSEKRASVLVKRGIAYYTDATQRQIAFRNMGEFITAFGRHQDRDPVDGKFEWHPKKSAGFMVMQAQHTTASLESKKS